MFNLCKIIWLRSGNWPNELHQVPMKSAGSKYLCSRKNLLNCELTWEELKFSPFLYSECPNKSISVNRITDNSLCNMHLFIDSHSTNLTRSQIYDYVDQNLDLERCKYRYTYSFATSMILNWLHIGNSFRRYREHGSNNNK